MIDSSTPSAAAEGDFAAVKECPLCGAGASQDYIGHPTYAKSASVNIMSCANCETSWADPCVSDPNLYDLIYTQAERIPGYRRYEKYANAVATESRALDFLADSEDVFWALREHLGSSLSSNMRILDVGSGMGYLVRALRAAGHDAVGIDSSQAAVTSAVNRFGPHFECRELGALHSSHREEFDLITMIEVIEHVPDIQSLLTSAQSLLRKDGALFVSTPNRSVQPGGVIWDTELPPIHLWWLSERTFSILADMLGMGLSLIDFTKLNRKEGWPLIRHKPKGVPTRRPVLGADGKPVSPGWKATIVKWLERIGALSLSIRARKLLRPSDYVLYPSRRPVLCAVLRKR